MRFEPNRLTVISVVVFAITGLVFAACTGTTGPSVEFSTPAQASDASVSDADPKQGVVETKVGEPGQDDADLANSRLGFVYKRGEAVGMKNGGRVPLGDDIIAEVFLSPYPPDWQTDLHLFLMDKNTFEPLTDVDVDLVYEMVYMDHGIDALEGTKVKDGHYLLPLSFLMYGDWSVDTTVELPEGKKHLRFIVKFFP